MRSRIVYCYRQHKIRLMRWLEHGMRYLGHHQALSDDMAHCVAIWVACITRWIANNLDRLILLSFEGLISPRSHISRNCVTLTPRSRFSLLIAFCLERVNNQARPFELLALDKPKPRLGAVSILIQPIFILKHPRFPALERSCGLTLC